MKVFLSWSKTYSGEIAKVLQKWLEDAFHQKITTFISSEGIEAGTDWYRKISDELDQCELGILVLTPENVNSPWIMYEAGALSGKKALIPILFERNTDRVEGPLTKRQQVTYDKAGFRNLLRAINKHIDAGLSEKMLDNFLKAEWDTLEKEIDPLVKKAKTVLPNIEREGLKNQKQDGVDLSASNIFKVNTQTTVSTSANDYFKQNMTVKDIPASLENFAGENLMQQYCMLEKLESGDVQTRFMINNTRISNFISFTDGKRIALFNRKKSADSTQMVQNPKIDVFGAVHFENGSMLKLKITNKEFHDAKVLKVESIPGFAFEDNESKNLEKETVMMFGFSVEVSESDLNKIVSESGNSYVYLKNTIEDMPKDITAKAELAYKFTQRKNKA